MNLIQIAQAMSAIAGIVLIMAGSYRLKRAFKRMAGI